ncbi:MAG: ammonium transporter [Acidobacteriia bacterium]|nr:ammonium transporter [Terriglobia bacterium]
MSAAGAPLPDADLLSAAFAALLIPFAMVGLAAINAGLGRSRNAAHLMTASLCVVAAAAIAYLSLGFAWQGAAGGPALVLSLGGKDWNWLARQPLFLRGIALSGSPVLLQAWVQLLCVGLTALIPLGGAAERWRLSAMCASTALLAGFVFPLFGHWAWGGGWLEQLGTNYHLGHGFVDAGGSGTIHTMGGLAALAMTWLLGPRRGKYTSEGMPTAIPGHNGVQVLFGCFMAWVGWLGVNTACSILFSGSGLGSAALIGLNTTLAAGSSGLVAAASTRVRFGRPDASLTANGWVAGLAAGSAGCAVVPPAAAILIGIVAGFLAPLVIEKLELRLSIDDPGGAVSVHAVGGIWGLIAVGMFARFSMGRFANDGNADSGQWVAQLIGVATLAGFILPLVYGLNWLLNRFVPHRVTPEGERQGLDLHELGAGAYPEFMTHTDEFFQR